MFWKVECGMHQPFFFHQEEMAYCNVDDFCKFQSTV